MSPDVKIDFDIENFYRPVILGRQTLRPQHDNYTHIHAYLNIEIKGRSLPGLGYFAANDVCFNEWITMLVGFFKAMQPGESGEYKFGPTDQGQPTYLFRKDGDNIVLSVISYEESGEVFKIPDWQDIVFSHRDFERALKQFRDQFLEEISVKGSAVAKYWQSAFASMS